MSLLHRVFQQLVPPKEQFFCLEAASEIVEQTRMIRMNQTLLDIGRTDIKDTALPYVTWYNFATKRRQFHIMHIPAIVLGISAD